MSDPVVTLDPEISSLIDERVGDLTERESLSKARSEGARLALEDLARDGQWPPPEDADETELEIALEKLARASAEIETLKAESRQVSHGRTHEGRAVLGAVVRAAKGATVAQCKKHVPGFAAMSDEAKGEFSSALVDRVRSAVGPLLGVPYEPPGKVG